MKLLSIIIPVYNAQKYLKDCLDSIVSELNDSIELIIVDDGSIDASADIYNAYDNNNIKLFKNENHGVSYSRNFGVDNASGKYISFVDADDFMTKGWSTILLDEINKKDNDVVFVLDNFPDVCDDKEKLLDYIFKVDNSVPWISTPWAKIFKREYLNNNNIRFKEDVMNGEDMLFNVQAILNTENISSINKSIYNYRVNPLSVTKTFKSKIFKSDQNFLKYLKEIFVNNQKFQNKYYNHCLENAIILFVDKISLLSKKNRKEYYYIFDEEPYKTFINGTLVFKNNFNKIVIHNVKKKRYDLAVFIIKLKKKVRNIIKMKVKNEYILKI